VEELEEPLAGGGLPKALALWFGFTILMTLMPIAANGVRVLDQGLQADTRTSPGLADVAGHGEFLLIAVAILAAALQDLFHGLKPHWGFRRTTLAVLAFSVSVFAALWFGDISALLANLNVSHTSPVLLTESLTGATGLAFLAAVVVGCCCVIARQLEL
jgi:hypothetical protein